MRTASSSTCAVSAATAAAIPSALATTTEPPTLVTRSATATRPVGRGGPSSTSTTGPRALDRETRRCARERVLGATRAEHRNDRRGSRPVVRPARETDGPDWSGAEMRRNRSRRAVRRRAERPRPASGSGSRCVTRQIRIRHDTDREQRKPSSRHTEGPLLSPRPHRARRKADVTAASTPRGLS